MGGLESCPRATDVKLLLDEHLSSRRIGTPLRRRGHDVEALHEEREAWGMSDEDVLERAAASGRIVVTRNGRHFLPLARAWADQDREHAGILVLWSCPSSAYGTIVDAVQATLLARPDQDEWVNLVLAA